MKFGVLASVLGQDWDAVFPIAHEVGLAAIELDWWEPEATQNGILSPVERARWRTLASEVGLEISGVAAHFFYKGGLAQADHEESAREIVARGIEVCHDLGAQTLLLPFFVHAELQNDEQKARLVDNLMRLEPLARAANVVLGCEHTIPAQAAQSLWKQVNSPFVGEYFDIGNAMCLGYNSPDEIRVHGSSLRAVHVKEWVGPAQMIHQQGEYPGLNAVPLGEGDVPLRESFAALREVGYDGLVTLETAPFDNARASVKAALEVARNASQPS